MHFIMVLDKVNRTPQLSKETMTQIQQAKKAHICRYQRKGRQCLEHRGLKGNYEKQKFGKRSREALEHLQEYDHPKKPTCPDSNCEVLEKLHQGAYAEGKPRNLALSHSSLYYHARGATMQPTGHDDTAHPFSYEDNFGIIRATNKSRDIIEAALQFLQFNNFHLKVSRVSGTIKKIAEIQNLNAEFDENNSVEITDN